VTSAADGNTVEPQQHYRCWQEIGSHVKGIIFNVAEHTVTAEFGADVWDDLLTTAGLDGAYTALGDYSIDELRALVSAASEKLELPAADVIRFVGRRGFPWLMQRYPEMATDHTSARSFVLSLNEVIHPEVRKLYPGADVPVFQQHSSDPGSLDIEYVSGRQLCFLAEGLTFGCADYFGETVSISQPKCQHNGDSSCLLRIEWLDHDG